MDGYHLSEPAISVQVDGNNNVVIVAGRSVNRWRAWREGNRPPLSSALRRRLGKLATGTLVVAASTLLRGSAPASLPPAPAAWPAEATALCGDGSFSPSRSRSGTCSRHGGVAHWRYPATHRVWRERTRPFTLLARACSLTPPRMTLDVSPGTVVPSETTGGCVTRAYPIITSPRRRGRS